MATPMSQNLGVVILSAGSSKDKMPGFPVFKNSPAFLPVNSRSLGKLVIDFYVKEAIDKIYLVVNKEDFEAATEEFGCFGSKLKIIAIANSGSVVDTLEQSLPQVEADEVIINIVTSIPNLLIPAADIIGINEKLTQIEGWSGLKIEKGGGITFMTKKESYGQVGHSFSGIFRASRQRVLEAASDIVGEHRKDLISIVAALHKRRSMKVVNFSWFDCGHVQNYFKTRSKIFGSRFFNSIALDMPAGVITKTSSNKEKLLRETHYIEKLPKELSVYFPRILNVSESGEQALNVEMEYYAYPTLAEVMLYWNLPDSMWSSVFENLSSTLSKFASYPGTCQKNDWYEIYVTKVFDRVKSFEESLPDELRRALFSGDSIRINGKNYLPWQKLKQTLPLIFEKIENPNDCTVVHGDYCFNNILCEPYVGLLKLLDPRGSFGESLVGIYGDKKYDWAKWGHSVVGRYDYIVNDLFHVRQESQNFELTTFDRPWQSQLDKLYWDCVEKSGIDKGLIKYIIGTLFVSMPPLHLDSRSRQISFFLKGIQFLNDGWGEFSSSLEIELV